MISYQSALQAMQPAIRHIYDALEQGLREADAEHVRRKLIREADPWYFLHSARRQAAEALRGEGLLALTDDGKRSKLPLSGIVVPYRGLAIRIIRPEVGKDRKGNIRYERVPIPGGSKARQNFWHQEPLPGMSNVENLLLVWTDSDGVLTDRMILARPIGGNHRRSSLRLSWDGPLSRGMANMRAADLDELRPDNQYGQLGDEAG